MNDLDDREEPLATSEQSAASESPEPHEPHEPDSPAGARASIARQVARFPGRVLIWAVRGYQLFISPWLGPNCRFTPTCSNYFIQAVKKYGAIKGSWRGFLRICRCHPFHPGGYDPP